MVNSDKPYRFKDLLEKLKLSERELLILGCEGKITFFVPIQNASIVWYARYHYDKDTPHHPSNLFEFEEPWHSEDITSGRNELFPVTPRCISNILHKGQADTQLKTPTNCESIFPEPPPDEIVSFICPLYGTRSTPTNTEIKRYQNCDTNSLLVKVSEVERYAKIQRDNLPTSIDTNAPGSEVEGNYFQFVGTDCKIRFNGGQERSVSATKAIKEIAERLNFPNEEKVFSTTILYEDAPSGDSEKSSPVPSGTSIQNGNNVVSPEMKENLAHHSLDLHERQARALLEGKESDADEIEGEISWLKTILRETYNATMRKDGFIIWGVCLDKNAITKEKNAHHNLLKRGIVDQIRAVHLDDLADHLENYLLKHNYYLPPPGFPIWVVTF